MNPIQYIFLPSTTQDLNWESFILGLSKPSLWASVKCYSKALPVDTNLRRRQSWNFSLRCSSQHSSLQWSDHHNNKTGYWLSMRSWQVSLMAFFWPCLVALNPYLVHRAVLLHSINRFGLEIGLVLRTHWLTVATAEQTPHYQLFYQVRNLSVVLSCTATTLV